jgi:DNA-binding MarR family transcriptional regulator
MGIMGKAIAGSQQENDAVELQSLAKHLEDRLNVIQRKLRQQLNAEFAQGKLTGPQRLVMSAVVGTDGLSLKQLSKRVNLAHSTVSGIADRLIKQGLLERQTDPTDGRITLFVPSKAVHQFLATRMPQLTLHPLVEALVHASTSQRDAVLKGVETLASLLTQDGG